MKKTLLLHIILTALIYYACTYSLDLQLSGLGFLLLVLATFFFLWLVTFLLHNSYFHLFKNSVYLMGYFLKQLFLSNLQMIYFILAPGNRFRPAILELPLSVKSDFGITLLANLITLTPGTITLEISNDKKYLYFHTVDVSDENLQKAKERIKNGFEKRIMKITG